MIKANIVSGLADLAEAAVIDYGEVVYGGLSGAKPAGKIEGNGAWPAASGNAFAAEWRVVRLPASFAFRY